MDSHSIEEAATSYLALPYRAPLPERTLSRPSSSPSSCNAYSKEMLEKPAMGLRWLNTQAPLTQKNVFRRYIGGRFSSGVEATRGRPHGAGGQVASALASRRTGGEPDEDEHRSYPYDPCRQHSTSREHPGASPRSRERTAHRRGRARRAGRRGRSGGCATG